MLEAHVISSVHNTLIDEGYYDIADIVDVCCTWADKGSLTKVKYWLKYGLEHNGNYRSTNIARRVEIASPKNLEHAFRLLEDELNYYIKVYYVEKKMLDKNSKICYNYRVR